MWIDRPGAADRWDRCHPFVASCELARVDSGGPYVDGRTTGTTRAVRTAGRAHVAVLDLHGQGRYYLGVVVEPLDHSTGTGCAKMIEVKRGNEISVRRRGQTALSCAGVPRDRELGGGQRQDERRSLARERADLERAAVRLGDRARDEASRGRCPASSCRECRRDQTSRRCAPGARAESPARHPAPRRARRRPPRTPALPPRPGRAST